MCFPRVFGTGLYLQNNNPESFGGSCIFIFAEILNEGTGAWSKWIMQPCLITTSLCIFYVTPCNLTPVLCVSATELNRLQCRHFFIFIAYLQLFYISSFTSAQKFDTAVTNDEYPFFFLSLVKQTSVTAVFQESVYDCIGEVAYKRRLSSA